MVIDVSSDSIAFVFRAQFLVLLDVENKATRRVFTLDKAQYPVQTA
jgi:hypothetical protein